MSTLDFFFSFRSPYSYLAAPRAFALADEYEVDLAFRGVIPMAMRGQKVPREKGLHTLRDVKREANRLGMPFGPVWDPLGDGAIRCLVVAEHAVDVGRERDFVLSASRAIWGEGVEVASDDGLRHAAERAGLDWSDCRAALRDGELRARVDANTALLSELGHWGVPILRFDDELFWGQDRIGDVKLALGAAGLRRS
jgi:2-hydroxychromene-2-carboxylate isomerase